jgi:glycine oxidase
VTRLAGLRLLVAGAGAVGSAVALRLQREGASVVLADPAAVGDNASGVAAGMLAPAFESVLDPVSEGHFPLLCAARDLWPAFAEELAPHGARLDRSGALWAGDPAGLTTMLERLDAVGARAERLSAAAARALSPGLSAPEGGVFTPEDWRIEADPMLRALRAAFLAAGGEARVASLRGAGEGGAELSDGSRLVVDWTILATGMPPDGFSEAPPELEPITPIKGQIARLAEAGPVGGPVVRAEGIYVTPLAAGVLAGATMEGGRRDRLVEPATIERLAGLAAKLFPALEGVRPIGAAGTRAATPDGLPLVGPSRSPGVRLALGARRNGWLLAPLIAEIIAAQLARAEPPAAAARFDPARFAKR